MLLTELKIKGFKSFREEVTLRNISPEINIILGRNGSGKSSIITAIQFLLLTDYYRLSREDRKSLINEGFIENGTALVEGTFDNKKSRFPAGDFFVVSRTLTKDFDECFLDGKSIKKDELRGMLENAGLTMPYSYFIVPQGRIVQITLLTDQERLALIHDIAGANVYEKDKKEALQFLEESQKVEEKIDGLLKKINGKMQTIEENQKVIKLKNEKEMEKKRIECRINEIEMIEIEKKLEEMSAENLVPIEEEISDDEIIMDIRNLEEELGDLEQRKFRLNVEGIEDKNAEEDLRKIENEIEETKKLIYAAKNRIEALGVEIEENDLQIRSREVEEKYKLQNQTKENLQNLINTKKAELQEGRPKYSEEEIQQLIMKRKKLWVEESRLIEKLAQIKENIKKNESVAMLRYSAFNSYKQIKDHKGVHGCVFELFNASEKFSAAIDAVFGSRLLDIVVENEDVAIELLKKIKTKITFLPLNRISSGEYQELAIDSHIIPLSNVVETKYKNIFKYLCKNTYLVSDLKSGTLISKNHKVNTVTIGGDFISKKGILTGGFEQKTNTIQLLKNKITELTEIEEKLGKIKNEIEEFSKIINEYEQQPKSQSKMHTKAFILYLEKRLHTTKGRKEIVSLDNLRLKKIRLMQESSKAQIDLEILRHRRDRKEEERLKIEAQVELNERLRQLKNTNEEILIKKRKHQELTEKMMFLENKNLMKRVSKSDYKTEEIKNEKRKLIERREALQEKVNSINFNLNDLQNKTKDELFQMLKQLNSEISKLPLVPRNQTSKYDEFFDQKRRIYERREELKKNRIKICDLIKELDDRKESAIALTYSMIQSNFAHVYKKLSGLDGSLSMREDGVSISINGDVQRPQELSGGQKTVLALALIFAIQNVDPSPFYFMDEVDANLDQESRIKLSAYLKEINAQFLITTFREELVVAGNNFFNVKFADKMSQVEIIEKENAMKELAA